MVSEFCRADYLIPNKYNIVEKTSPTVEDTSAKNTQAIQLPTPPVSPNQPLNNSIYRVCNLDGNGEKFLALKDGPNASSERVAKMTEGTELSMLEKNGDWYQVKMADGRTGWAHSKWLCQSNGQSTVTEKTPSTASSNQSITPSFNCLNASTRVEKMICNSEELAKLDAQLSVVYKATLSVDPEKELLKKYQDNWRKNIRDMCSIESCVKSAYKNRIAELK
ncbi:MAG: SH3 domain-containing protein [Burkholderiaceae bacterium]|nr:SH3 domain-containing protein [Burkholderiaceae bacterium]